MNRGLVERTLREIATVTAGIAVALFAVQMLFARFLSGFYKDLSESFFQIQFVQRMFSAFIGSDVGAAIGQAAMASVFWLHPIVLALVWTHALIVCTRVPAGEVDRGTIDLLLSLPATRACVYASETIAWLIAGFAIVACTLAGNLLGGWSFQSEPVGTVIDRLVISANLFALYMAVGGLAWLASALCDRRGRAFAIAFVILIASYILNFLAAFNETLRRFSFLSLVSHYRPLFVLRDGAKPVGDILVLTAVAAICWIAGAIIFTRRDLRTV